MNYYQRHPAAVVVTKEASLLVVADSGVHVMDDVNCRELSAVLAGLHEPTAESELLKDIEADTLELLVELGVLVRASTQQRANVGRPIEPAAGDESRIIAGITGAIAAAWMPPVLHRLRISYRMRVDVVLTESAARLVSAEALRYLGIHVWQDIFDIRIEANVPHIHLASQANAVLIMPATAHTLFKLAHGECGDLLSLVASATDAPVIVVPSMNRAMWESAAVERNVQQLRLDGVYVVEPGLGFEVSQVSDGDLAVGGMGVNGANIGAIIEAVLAARDSDA